LSLNSLKNILWLLKNRRSFKNWKKRNFQPPSPEFIKHQIIKNNNLENSLWIETGTYYGETTRILSEISSKTISIEADKQLYNLSRKKLANLSNVEIVLGDSKEILPNIINSNLKYDNICFYLDAHLCHDHLKKINTFGNEDSSTPIRMELSYIENSFKNFKKINILIDDIRFFVSNFQNYPNINYLTDWCEKNNLEWKIEHDIFIANKH
jgi:hypothetical protein|tara:strand:- start:14 stop:643 length:630 start_codon:yes stop_codon:yes gene_type:complete